MAPLQSSISKRLTLMNMLVSGIVLLLACAAFFGYDLITYRQSLVRNLSIQSQVIASNSVSALVFNDPKSAETTLSALKAAPHVVYAEIYTPDGHPFAGYRRDGSRDEALPMPELAPLRMETYWFEPDHLALTRAIVFEGKPIGVVYIRIDLGALYDRLQGYAEIVGIILLASLGAAFVISRVSQRTISKPVVELASTARIVSRERDYSQRAKPAARNDEIGVLIGAFNEMLAQIQQRDAALLEAHDDLDAKVKERTAELKLAEENLRVLSTRLLQLQDEERRHISRELHDSSGQSLAALGMNLAIVKMEASKVSPEAAKAIAESVALVRSTTQELRTMSYLLHPPLLDEAGLDSTLRWYVDGFSERSKITVELQLPEEMGRLPRNLEMGIFRIVQESLTNIHRHSGSSSATICLEQNNGEIRLEVRDQGKGMPVDGRSPSGEIVRPGIGIQGMRERVMQLAGRLEIKSSSTGTVVLAVLPVPEAEVHEAREDEDENLRE
ncbi:MAG TPA: CHASE sensor domain-containing protein [Candidatus Acidoferrales bacterium]|nr:CHASE sensor domain-containing protein [Candidatus Acidoferrales bacterium]